MDVTPTITSLTVNTLPHNLWKRAFFEVLDLLEIIRSSKPFVKVDDQRLCFQPSHDLSEISTIYLSVSNHDLQYNIDLKTICIMPSNSVPPAVITLQEYANKVLGRYRDFRARLLQNNILIEDSPRFLSVDMFTCPVCFCPLISCLECEANVACSNRTCPASLEDHKQCPMHGHVVCDACLRQSETIPPLVRCPMCQGWCCREDVDWCTGLIVQPTLGSEELAKLSHECDWDSKTIVRSHPPKHGPCCLCTDGRVAPGWLPCRNRGDTIPDRCPSQTPFMNDHELSAAFCPDCLESSPGHHCACELSWLCSLCFAVRNKTLEYPILMSCPRCGVHYCTGSPPSCADAIEICRGCKGVILCKNCQEEEELPGRVQAGRDLPKQVVFVVQCTFCEAWSCGDCSASEGTARCAHCREWYCRACIATLSSDAIRPCGLCGEPVCRGCRADARSCDRAMEL